MNGKKITLILLTAFAVVFIAGCALTYTTVEDRGDYRFCEVGLLGIPGAGRGPHGLIPVYVSKKPLSDVDSTGCRECPMMNCMKDKRCQDRGMKNCSPEMMGCPEGMKSCPSGMMGPGGTPGPGPFGKGPHDKNAPRSMSCPVEPGTPGGPKTPECPMTPEMGMGPKTGRPEAPVSPAPESAVAPESAPGSKGPKPKGECCPMMKKP